MRFSAEWTGSCHSDEKALCLTVYPPHPTVTYEYPFYLWIPHGTDGEICSMEVFFMTKKKAIPLRVLIISAMLAAVSIVLGKYLAFNIGELLRFSFENLPIIFAGAVFGPLVGAAVGIVADLIGCLLVGYAINPLVTLGAAIIGAVSGVVFKLPPTSRLSLLPKTAAAVSLSHILGSVIVKSIGLAAFYSQPLWAVMLMRLGNYTIIALIEGAILYPLLKSRALEHAINAFSSRIYKNGGKRKMTYDEALAYIHGISWTFCKPGLERTEELTRRLGNPEDSLKFVHVAGTNGKGSFSSMLASVLEESGLKVGLYTSPYIVEFGERMRVNGENITKSELSEITEYVKPYAEAMTDKPTEFELITAIAFEFFKRRGVDIVVLEAGMGGRLDSTNIIKTPVLSVITGIALDHTAFLGDTVEKIAAEKAGIIKSDVPVLFGGRDKSCEDIIRERACELSSPFYLTRHDTLDIKEATLEGTLFDYSHFKDVKIELLGSYQPRNAANVLEAVDILRGRGYDIPDSAVYRGLRRAKWPARFEIISHAPLTVYDGAHNAEGIASAVESIKALFPDTVYAVTGVLADKDYRSIAYELSSVASRAYTITPDNPRALSAEAYAEVLRSYGVEATPYDSIDAAIAAAKSDAKRDKKSLVCLGSLYIYSDVKNAIRKK